MKQSKAILIVPGCIILIVLVLLLVFNTQNNDNPKQSSKIETQSLMDYEEYKSINNDNINKITIIRYTEAGQDEKIITDKTEITSIYNYLKSINIGKETKMACEDNTTIYKIELNNKKEQTIEIECDWVIINNKRFSIK